MKKSMNRRRVVALGIALAAFLFVQQAFAARYLGSTQDKDNGDIWMWYINDDWSYKVVIIDTKGNNKTITWWNPDPEGGGSGKGDLDSRIALLKRKGGIAKLAGDFWKSPAGKQMTGKGKGPKPVINPSDDDRGGGPSDPSKGAEKLGSKAQQQKFKEELNKLAKENAKNYGGKGGGFQYNSGSPADQLKKPGGPGNPGGPGGGTGDDDKDKNKPGSTGYAGAPELVDPLGPPISFDKKKSNKSRLTKAASQQAPAGTKAQGSTKAGSSSQKPAGKRDARSQGQNKDKVGDEIETPR
ncbi:MAG TPA: hypothetical protein VGK77_25780 [Candidatus Binatia bacterium]|jgi:hypothetical protein